MSVTTLDVKGLNCPLPVLRARKAMGGVPAGGTLRVLATDPGAVRDFEAFVRATDATMLSSTEADGVFVFEIRKAG
ncbi:MAG: sulfurtransferase TusA family protein [Rhodospirillales bacterium]|nr:sulfurtransferase TusA family protein [Rhodospirillales bacterium]